MTDSLFAHLAHRFPVQPEVLATDGFAWVLGRSEAARQAFVAYCHPTGAKLDAEFRFHPQEVLGTAGRPDLVGRDELGVPRIVVEAKFWASLGDQQVTAYLGWLEAQVQQTMGRVPPHGALLLFVGPSRRRTVLWTAIELASKVSSSADVGPLRFATAPSGVLVALTSWGDLLSAIRAAPGVVTDADVDADLRQIEGLAARQDSAAFLPLAFEDLSATGFARRWRDYDVLIDAACDELEKAGTVSRKGLSTGKDRHGWGKYIGIDGTDALLGKNATMWRDIAPTPLWLRFWGLGLGKNARRARLALADWVGLAPPKLFEWRSHAAVPLYLPCGAEKDDVVASIVRDVTTVAQRIREVPLHAVPAVVEAHAVGEELDEEEEPLAPE